MINIFNPIGKKNNQTPVSDADRKILILESTDFARNSINHFPGIIRLPSIGISRSASETDVDSICLTTCRVTLCSRLMIDCISS